MKLINKENTTIILLVIILILCLIIYSFNKEAFFDTIDPHQCVKKTNCHNDLHDMSIKCPEIFKEYVIKYVNENNIDTTIKDTKCN